MPLYNDIIRTSISSQLQFVKNDKEYCDASLYYLFIKRLIWDLINILRLFANWITTSMFIRLRYNQNKSYLFEDKFVALSNDNIYNVNVKNIFINYSVISFYKPELLFHVFILEIVKFTWTLDMSLSDFYEKNRELVIHLFIRTNFSKFNLNQDELRPPDS